MGVATTGLRLAMFTPLPPAPSGIADYVADLLPLLPAEWQIDVFVDDPTTAAPPPARPLDVHPAQQWRQRHAAHPYDLNVYQVGNSTAQAWLWPRVLEAPGLLVLHDAVLHPARVAAHLATADIKGYRRSVIAARPDIGPALGQLVVSGLGGEALFRAFPLCEDLVRASRLTVVHGELLAGWVRALLPGARVASATHWRSVPPVSAEHRQQWRSRLGAASDCPLIGSFGHLGPAHRNDLVLEALAALPAELPFRLVFAGAVEDEVGLRRRAAALRLSDRLAFTGPLSPLDFAAVMAAVDIALNLRYPTARSSSGTMQQLMQLGVPLVVHDLLHLRDVPADAVGRVPTDDAETERRRLREVLERWLVDVDERRRIGATAAAWAARHVTPTAMCADYVAAVERALGHRAAS